MNKSVEQLISINLQICNLLDVRKAENHVGSSMVTIFRPCSHLVGKCSINFQTFSQIYGPFSRPIQTTLLCFDAHLNAENWPICC